MTEQTNCDVTGEEQERAHEGAREGGGGEAAPEAAGGVEEDVPPAAGSDAQQPVQAAVQVHGGELGNSPSSKLFI